MNVDVDYMEMPLKPLGIKRVLIEQMVRHTKHI